MLLLSFAVWVKDFKGFCSQIRIDHVEITQGSNSEAKNPPHVSNNIQSGRRDKNIPDLTRVPYDRSSVQVVLSSLMFSLVVLGLLIPLYCKSDLADLL